MTHRSITERAVPLFLDHDLSQTQFAADVRVGLSEKDQKKLYPKYFYDELGSALFEAITFLPEYGLTRADARLLQKHSGDLIQLSQNPAVIAELGSGTGAKTRLILGKISEPHRVTYCPIDISEFALAKCVIEARQAGKVAVHPFPESYLAGLARAVTLRPTGRSMLVLFLGSTIGNFDPDEAEQFCLNVRRLLEPEDIFLLSTDLEQSVPRMIAAYDDALGVTAAFNLNILGRINRELNGTFDLSRFRHLATYNPLARRIEMHLKSLERQRVVIDRDFALTFFEGETIWTESSYKFRPKDLLTLAQRTGFSCEMQWIDEEWSFAQNVFKAV